MNSEEFKTTSLSILQGEGKSIHATKPSLRLITSVQSPPQQLELFAPRLESPKIVSIGFDGITLTLLESIIKSEGVKNIIDIRLSPSFLGRGFSIESFRSLVEHSKTSYEHAPIFANKYIGESWDHDAVMRKYADYIQTQRDALSGLEDKLKDGPLLLLGRTPCHESSARAVIVNALVELGFSFLLRVIDKSDEQPKHSADKGFTSKTKSPPDHVSNITDSSTEPF